MRDDLDLQLAFDRYTFARQEGLRNAWHEIYPAATELDVPGFQEPHEPPLLVDVGGSTGYDAASFKTENSHIKGRCVVQDLPEALASSPAPSESVEMIPYDFFTVQPIKGILAKVLVNRGADLAQALEHTSSRPSVMNSMTRTVSDYWVTPSQP